MIFPCLSGALCTSVYIKDNLISLDPDTRKPVLNSQVVDWCTQCLNEPWSLITEYDDAAPVGQRLKYIFCADDSEDLVYFILRWG